MQFRRVDAKNFMSYPVLEIRDLDHPELVLIEGKNLDEGDSNGSGKSTLWDAISFALFGSTVRGLKGDDVMSWWTKKDTYASVECVLKGETYVVTRYRKDSDYGDRLIVNHTSASGKKVVELGTIAQTQEWIEQTFGIDFELFRCTVLFAQGETFNFVDSGNKTQKEILSKVMKINFDSFLDRAKRKLKALQEEQTEIDRKMIVLNSHLKEDDDLGFEEDIKNWDATHKEEIARMRLDLQKAKKEAQEIRDSITDNEKLEELGRKLKKNYDTAVAKHRELTKEIGGVHQQMHALDKEQKRIGGLSGDCPVCLQPTSKEVLERVSKVKGKEHAELAAKFSKLNDEEMGMMKVIEDARSKMNKVAAKISAGKEQERLLKRYGGTVERISEDLETLKAEVNPFLAKQEEEREKQQQIKEKIAKFKKQEKKILADIPYHEFWVRGFGDAGIKSFIFDLVCANLTNKTNKHLNTLTKGTVTVSFDTQKKLKSGEVREKFDCEIVKDGKRVDYASYSGGEKRRISLAVDMALSEIMSDYYGSSFSMVVFDEQTNYLDKQGRTDFMSLLKEIALKKKVFVVDHDAEFKAKFDEVWVAQKKNGKSELSA